MKQTALKPSTKRMAQGGLSSPTKAEVAVFDMLADQIGCVVCLFHCRHPDGSRVEGSIAQIHHILSGGNRISHSHVIPLCKMHHDEGQPGNPSRHSIMGKYGKAEFEEKFGTEMELVLECEEWINLDYCTGSDIHPNEELEDDERPSEPATGNDQSHDTGADADGERDYSDGEIEPPQVCQVQGVDYRYFAEVMHHRYRLADPDNLNAKGALDGFVNAGILKDDSPKYVAGIKHEQTKVKSYGEEKTEITLFKVMTKRSMRVARL